MAIFKVSEGFRLITSTFVISFGCKLPKVFSYVSTSVSEQWYRWENSKLGIFLAKSVKKLPFFSFLRFSTNNFKFCHRYQLKSFLNFPFKSVFLLVQFEIDFLQYFFNTSLQKAARPLPLCACFLFLQFLLWNHVRYVMLSVYKLVLAPSDYAACCQQE